MKFLNPKKAMLLAVFAWSMSAAFCQTSQFDITAYGAVKNSGEINTKSIQAAIDACFAAGGGDVVIPAGEFLSGTIHLKSNINLHLQMGAILRGSTNLNDYETYIPDKPFNPNHLGLIFTQDAENVSITGEGQIDGSGDSFFETTIAKKLDSATTAYTRQKTRFRHLENGLGDGPIQPKDRPYQMIVFSKSAYAVFY